jgi:hypothetical protein
VRSVTSKQAHLHNCSRSLHSWHTVLPGARLTLLGPQQRAGVGGHVGRFTSLLEFVPAGFAGLQVHLHSYSWHGCPAGRRACASNKRGGTT